jgi:hypothetical protein
MPHLHLPIDHTDADLVLAANLAEIVGSEDLYVAWTHESGPGAIPEVEAVMVEETAAAGFFVAVSAGFVAFWRALLGKPSRPAGAEDAGSARPYADQGQTSAG